MGTKNLLVVPEKERVKPPARAGRATGNALTGAPWKLIALALAVAGFSLLAVSPSYAQDFEVAGEVVDEGGDPVPGVNVLVKGTDRGTATDPNGAFSIRATSAQDTLVFSFIGYQAREEPISGRSEISVTLSEAVSELDEVVVVGYGEQTQGDVTGAISSVSAEEVREVPVTNVSEAIQGRVAGVQVNQTSTRPGQSPQIRIRGTRSLSAGNDPLIVVNDIPFQGSINDLNTANIESVQVLKDASATAIYGSRGANGVILITTKQGSQGADPNISYSAYQGINTVARRYDVFSGPEFIAMRDYAGYTSYTQREQVNRAAQDYTDWQDLLYESGALIDQQLNVSGGTETTTYAFGGGYFSESAVTPGQDFRRFSLSADVQQEIGNHLEIGLSTNNSYGITRGESASFMYPILTTTPLSPAYDSTGAIVNVPSYPNEEQYSPLLLNEEDSWIEERKRIASYNSLFLDWQMIDVVRYRLNVGGNYRQDQYGNFYGSDTPFNSGGINTAQVNNGAALDYTVQNLLYYNDTYGTKHNLNATALFELNRSRSNNTDVRAQDLVANFAQYYNLGLSNGTPTTPAGNQNYAQRTLISYMGRVNYNYDDRYLITVTGRVDGASVLAEQNRWNAYPSAALAWRAINESWMENQGLFSDLKVRVSYGETANQAVAPYRTLGSLTQNLYNFGGENAYGYYVSNLPNTALGWETTRSFNAGIDFGVLQDRVTGSVEAYRQYTYDLLLNQSLPPTGGVPGAFLTNIGETRNQGLEVTLSTVNFASPDNGFNWGTDVNFYLNRNEILSLNGGVEQDIGNGWFVGQPINVIYDYEKLGIWQLDEASEAAEYGQEPGEIRVADLNNDGQITGEDRSILGTLNPDFEFGITNRFDYRGFDLSVFAFGRIGGKLISTIHQPQSYLNMLTGRRNGVRVDYWTPTNPTNAYPKPDLSRGDNPLYGSTLGYFDGSFLSIRNISLGYALPSRWVNAIGGKSARFYLNVKNVAVLFSPYLNAGGVTPQATGFGAQGVFGAGIPGRQLTIGSNTPPTRTFGLGLNLTL